MTLEELALALKRLESGKGAGIAKDVYAESSQISFHPASRTMMHGVVAGVRSDPWLQYR
jgi:hypothetical protein